MDIEKKIEGIKLGKNEKKIIDILKDGEMVKTEEIVKRVYNIEIDKSSKQSIRTMICRTNRKIIEEGLEIKNRENIGYYIREMGKEEKRDKKRRKKRGEYRKIERISEDKLIDIIRNLRKEKNNGNNDNK